MSVVPVRPTRVPAQGVPARRLFDVAGFLGVAAPAGAEQVTVSGIAQHSKHVFPGDIYVARPGVHAHGAGFAQVAASAGAVAALTDAAGRAPCEAAGLPTVVVEDPAAVLGSLSAWLYGDPTRALTVLGVTGTNGKTTTSYLLEAALSRSGHRTGMIGTVETRIEDQVLPSSRTTPEAPDLQALFAVMRERGVDSVSMEVSSHALALGRVAGTSFAVAGFTNLSQDHFELHGDLESYFEAKAMLFTREFTPVAVINVDDPFGVRLADLAARRGVDVVPVSPSGNSQAMWHAGPITYAQAGALGFDVRGPDRIDLRIALGVPGDFNRDNALVAAAMLHVVGVSEAAIVTAFAGVQMPGRMERISGPGRRSGAPIAIVDYAHTPDAITTALRSVRKGTRGRLIVVVGCGGDRDQTKRPLMGAAAVRGADFAVITDDNPRSEDPATIRAAALVGAEGVPPNERAEVIEIGDRREAIRWAIGNAEAGDTVLVLGKGHEKGQEIRGVVHPFDDREVVAEALSTRAVGANAVRERTG